MGRGRNLGQLAFFLLIVSSVLYIGFFQNFAESQTIAYSDLVNEAKKGNIKEIVWSYPESRGVMVNKDSKKGTSNFKVFIPNPEDVNLFKIFEDKNVKITAEASKSGFWVILMNILPIVFIILISVLMIRQFNSGGGPGGVSFGRSRHKIMSDEHNKVTFKDVAGVDEAKEELREIVDFLRKPEKYTRIGARIPKGVLLLGAPGTGKTLLGKAVAGEAGVPFFFMSGSDFVEMFVGVGASRVRDLFEQAKKSAPCIIFIDEIDAVGRQRGAGYGGGHDEREQTLNQLLVEMDGFESNSGVIMLAATNRHDVLDPALLRPGRFDRHIVVDQPDVKGRKEILKVHARNKMIDRSVNLDVIAKRTPGFSGADLENLLNEAALLAARNNKKTIRMHECEEAIERVIMGPERKSRILSEEEKKIIAYHETGHAIAGLMTPGADPVRKITILPRGMALGVTWSMPEDDKYLQSKEELIARMIVMLGGRAAEEIVFGRITTGAANDLEKTTELARKIVVKYGMTDRLGLVTYGKNSENVFLGRDIVDRKDYSDSTAEAIDSEMKALVDDAYEKSKKLLSENREKMDLVVAYLLEHEVMDGDDLKSMVEKGFVEPPPPKTDADDDEDEDGDYDEDGGEGQEDDSSEDEVSKDSPEEDSGKDSKDEDFH